MDTSKITNIPYNNAPSNSPAKAESASVKKSKKKKAPKKDIYNETPIRKLGTIDDTARVLKPFLAAAKSPIVRAIPPIAYTLSGVYMASDVYDKYKKGEDGTGEKPSIKMGFRQALYQGVTSILAPIGIIKGTKVLTKRLFTGTKVSGSIEQGAKVVKNLAQNNSVTKKMLSAASTPVKVIGALASVFALSKLIKPIDFVVDKLFKITVDPLLGIGKQEK